MYCCTGPAAPSFWAVLPAENVQPAAQPAMQPASAASKCSQLCLRSPNHRIAKETAIAGTTLHTSVQETGRRSCAASCAWLVPGPERAYVSKLLVRKDLQDLFSYYPPGFAYRNSKRFHFACHFQMISNSNGATHKRSFILCEIYFSVTSPTLNV